MNFIENWIDQLLVNWGLSTNAATSLRLVILLVLMIIAAFVSYWLTKLIITKVIYKVVRKTTFKWDDILADRHVLGNVSHIVPAVIVRILAPVIFQDYTKLLPLVEKMTDVYLVVMIVSVIVALLKVFEHWLSSLPSLKDKPLTSYFQLFRIILYIVAFILLLSLLIGKDPTYFLGAFGAMTAVLILIFKDTILGLVASVQISSNDMLKVGDWVEMPKYNADGDVVAINLYTVKVQNWDKTITSIPTYYLVTDSFKNWRGMVKSGGRRIKRSIYIDAHSIKFVDPEMRERYKKFQLITDYITNKQSEIEQYNSENQVDTSALINGRRMTNIGVFRKYVDNYLKTHPRVKQNMTIMVRQLSIEDRGIPMEIYCFTNTTEWLEYEEIQANIFDHLLSSTRFFDLEIFQQPGGKDISGSIEKLAETLQQKQ